MKVINKNNFEETVTKEKHVLVDFWAPWCGPCKIITPILEEISKERKDIQIVKLNVDDNQEIALQYDVKSIPTIMLFEDGKQKDRIVGALPKEKINIFLNEKIK